MSDSAAQEPGAAPGNRTPDSVGGTDDPRAAERTGRDVGQAAEEASERLRTRQLARLGALFAGFAHEIRNPLSTIRLNLQLVREDLGVAESPREARIGRRVEVVEGEVVRLQAILDQFLNFVRVPALQVAPVRLAELIGSIVEFTAPELEAAGIEVRVSHDPTLPEVLLDADQVRAVVVNLLRNAQDACEPGDEILVRTVRRGDEALVVVADTGAGMDEEVQERAFQPYFSTKKHGTGLGLPTARRVVEQHGGRLVLDSEPGRGTQFTIHLPIEGHLPIDGPEGAASPAGGTEGDA